MPTYIGLRRSNNATPFAVLQTFCAALAPLPPRGIVSGRGPRQGAAMAKRPTKRAGKLGKGSAAGKRSRPESPKKKSTSSPFQAFCEKSGLRFDLSQCEVLSLLQESMGDDRFEEWRSISIDRHYGEASAETEYLSLDGADEINTLCSLQSHVSLTVYEWLSEQVRKNATKGCKLGDLGCGSGILAGWLASQHPDCRVFGFDALPNMIRAAETSHKAENLRFKEWDYSYEACPEPGSYDLLVSCFGIDSPSDTQQTHWHSLKDPSLRSGDGYTRTKSRLKGFFRRWRTAAKDDALAFLVLRIPYDSFFLATIDAAHEEGWTFDLPRYESLKCGAENFPAMTFKAAHSPVPPEHDLLSAWAHRHLHGTLPALTGTAAVCFFNALAGKEILNRETQSYGDGHDMESIVGRSGAIGFQFTHATTAFAQLTFMPAHEAASAKPWFPESDFLGMD